MHRVAIVSIQSASPELLRLVVDRWRKRAEDGRATVLIVVAGRNPAEDQLVELAEEAGLQTERVAEARLAHECTDIVALWDGRDVGVASLVSAALRVRRRPFLHYAESDVWYTQPKLIGSMVREAIRQHQIARPRWNERAVDPFGRGYRNSVKRGS